MRDPLPKLELIRIFCLVGETRYFKAAAQRLGITPSAVSQAVSSLESYFGTELFLRGSRPLQLTNAGRRLIREGAPIVKAAETLRIDFMRMDLSQVSLRLGLGETITATLSPWIVGSVHARVAQLEVTSQLNKPLADKLRNGDLDICIFSNGLLEDRSDWFRVPIYEENYFLVVSANYNHEVDLQQLKDLACSRPYICYTEGSSDRELTDRFLRTWGIEPRQRIHTSSSFCLVGLVPLVNGWTLLPPTNLWCGGRFDQFVRAILLPRNLHCPVRRMWALGNPRFASETNWLAELTREKFLEHTLPELARISAEVASGVRLLA